MFKIYCLAADTKQASSNIIIIVRKYIEQEPVCTELVVNLVFHMLRALLGFMLRRSIKSILILMMLSSLKISPDFTIAPQPTTQGSSYSRF